MHDTIGCYLDIDKGQVKFSKNGKLAMDLRRYIQHLCVCVFLFFWIIVVTAGGGRDLSVVHFAHAHCGHGWAGS